MKKLFNLNAKKATLVIIILSAGLLSVNYIIIAQENPWIQKADMPAGRHAYATGVVNGKIYAIGGRYTGQMLNEYNPVTDTQVLRHILDPWEHLADLLEILLHRLIMSIY